VADSCEHGDGPAGSGATELVVGEKYTGSWLALTSSMLLEPCVTISVHELVLIACG